MYGDRDARATLLKLEEEAVERQCAEIIRHKPDVVITEKGLSDLAMHFLTKAGISAIRRLRKTDNNRIARATGATIVHRCGQLRCLSWYTALFTVTGMGGCIWCFQHELWQLRHIAVPTFQARVCMMHAQYHPRQQDIWA